VEDWGDESDIGEMGAASERRVGHKDISRFDVAFMDTSLVLDCTSKTSVRPSPTMIITYKLIAPR
jgi:hypothetical protein